MVVSEEIITFNSVFFTKWSVSHRNVFKRWLPFWVTSPLPSCFATVDPKILPVQSIIRGNVCVTWPWYNKATWALIDPIGRPREPGYDNGGSFILFKNSLKRNIEWSRIILDRALKSTIYTVRYFLQSTTSPTQWRASIDRDLSFIILCEIKTLTCLRFSAWCVFVSFGLLLWFLLGQI